MDALRPDHLGCYGYPGPTSACIDSLAEQSLLFRNIHAQATETKSSAATLFTSTYPSVHNTFSHADHLPTNLTTMASCLQDAGFITVIFNGNFRIGEDFGFSRGFDYVFDLHKRPGFEDIESLPPSEMITDDILAWLDREELGDARKIFILAWAVDTHIPFNPPDEFKKAFFRPGENVPAGTIEDVLAAKSPTDHHSIIALYDAEIAHNDYNIKRLIDSLEQRELWETATFILTADHGETFMEHGQFLVHGSLPHKEITHVPLLLKSPAIQPGISEHFGGLIDIMPTILALNDIALPDTVQGNNLCGSLHQQQVYIESLFSYGKATAVLTEQWRLVQWPSPVNLIFRRLFNRDFHSHSQPEKPLPTGEGDIKLPLESLKRVRSKRFFVDLRGTPPKKTWNLFTWFLEWLKYYITSQRLELYCRIQDPLELCNVTAQFKKEIPGLLSLLLEHHEKNRRLQHSLDLKQDQSIVSEKVTSRLRSLGYLD